MTTSPSLSLSLGFCSRLGPQGEVPQFLLLPSNPLSAFGWYQLLVITFKEKEVDGTDLLSDNENMLSAHRMHVALSKGSICYTMQYTHKQVWDKLSLKSEKLLFSEIAQ